MQIVIEIPKRFYEHVKGHKDIFTYGLINGEKIGEIIASGIVLPEHHGRLIDADKIQITNYEIFINDFKESLKLLIERIRNAPTILEGTVNE